MDKAIVHIPRKDNPVLLDQAIQDLQVALTSHLPWLNYAFGKAYRLVEHRLDGDKFVYPAVYNDKAEYMSMVPNDNLGNFSWFDIYDPQEVQTSVVGRAQITARGAIVFWFNLLTIYEDASAIYTEEVKAEILDILTGGGILSGNSHLDITTVYERFENIYKGYSIEKVYNNYIYSGEDIQGIDKQFFMFPYAGLRFEFTLATRDLCQRFIPR